MPISVFTTGKSAFWASSSSSSCAPLLTAPPPTSSTGRCALFSTAAACCSCSGVACGSSSAAEAALGSLHSSSSTCTLLGISTSTGPGLPSCAKANALRNAGSSSSLLRTSMLYLVIGIVTPTISISWKESRPSMLTPT